MSTPILVMGATSGIGKAALDEATARGLNVRAFSRSAETLPTQDHVETMAGDATDEADVARAVAGCRAVIYALGVKERLAMLWETETLFSRSTGVLIPAMQAAGVKRLVAVTGMGAGRSKSALSAIERAGHWAFLGRPYDDKDRQEAAIMASDLDWTIARPTILTNRGKSGRMHVLTKPDTWRMGWVSRADVAEYLVNAIEDGLNVQEDVVLTR
ncbi:MAG: NAD(P)-binding oxidoreductase [Pseudomonadota bacterium]